MTRFQHFTVFSIMTTTILGLTTMAQAQTSFGSGGIRIGGSGRSTPSFSVGRQVRSRARQTWAKVKPPTTDMRYRGPNCTPKPCPTPEPVIVTPPVCSTPKPHPAPLPVVETPQPIDDATLALEMTYEAQDAFREENYALATERMNEVVKLSPESAAAYQFRALTHFAQGNYDNAAADAYETLLRGPLWNWETVYPLYGNKQTYENQYRALTVAAKTDSQSMSKHFIMAYHHLVLGHLEHGEKELQHVLTIQPNEPVTVKLLTVVQERRTEDKVATR